MQIRETRAVRGGRLLLLAAAALAGGTLRAEIVEYWAPGVSETSGWYNTFQFRNGCWAGCSTDMFVWWQDRIREKYDTSAMTKIWTNEELIQEYDTNPYFGNGGDYPWRALEWALTNTCPTVHFERPGYGYMIPLTETNRPILYVVPCYNSIAENVEAAILGGFTNGNCIATIASESHAWTLYGIGYNTETKRLTHIWVTDPVPDSYANPRPSLKKVDIKYYNNICYFEVGIYDPENGSWNNSPIYPEYVTFLSVDDKYLVDRDGSPSFPRLTPGTGPDPAPEHAAIGSVDVSGVAVELVGRARRESGFTYELLSTTDLGAPDAGWQVLDAAPETTADGRVRFRHARDAAEPERFYRLRVSRPASAVPAGLKGGGAEP